MAIIKEKYPDKKHWFPTIIPLYHAFIGNNSPYIKLPIACAHEEASGIAPLKEAPGCQL